MLDEPDLAGLDAGIVLQAYLPDAHEALDRLASWAVQRHERGGGRIKVRLVKGANLAMERVDAELHGWPQAPYPTKPDVDATYKRLLDRALDPCWGDALRVGLASHNLFDVAWGVVRADRLGTRHRLELEMLEGMAPGEAEAVRRRAGSVLLYAPVVRRDEFDAAIAYLVRRLDENTSPENFLRHQFDLAPGSPELAEQRDRFLDAVARARRRRPARRRRAQCRDGERRTFDPHATVRATSPTPTGRAAEPRVARPDARGGRAPSSTRCRSWPVAWCSHRRRRREAVPSGSTPRRPTVPSTATGWPTCALVDRAVDTARRAQPAWGATTAARSCRAARPVCGGARRASR